MFDYFLITLAVRYFDLVMILKGLVLSKIMQETCMILSVCKQWTMKSMEAGVKNVWD